MSNYWNVRCFDCQKASETDINHGDHILRSAINAYPKIKEVLEDETNWYIEISLLGYGNEVFSFLREHDGHRIILTDEHGQTDDTIPTFYDHGGEWCALQIPKLPCPDYDPNQLIPCKKWRQSLEQGLLRASTKRINQ